MASSRAASKPPARLLKVARPGEHPPALADRRLARAVPLPGAVVVAD